MRGKMNKPEREGLERMIELGSVTEAAGDTWIWLDDTEGSAQESGVEMHPVLGSGQRPAGGSGSSGPGLKDPRQETRWWARLPERETHLKTIIRGKKTPKTANSSTMPGKGLFRVLGF